MAGISIHRAFALACLVTAPAFAFACASLSGLSEQPPGDSGTPGPDASQSDAPPGPGPDGALDVTPTGDASCGDLQTDPNNCGACGHVCAATFGCIDGVCGNTVVKIASGPGAYHTCAVLKSGNLYCWGQNNVGQIGTGDVTNHLTATLVAKDVDNNPFDHVVDVTTGAEHTCAQKADKSVFCWGSEAYGQTAQAIAGEQHTPLRVLSLSGYLQVRAGGYRTCGIDGSNHVWCWGDNQHLGLGHASASNGDYACGSPQNQTQCNNVPVLVSGLTGATSLAMGYDHTCAAGTSISCWGGNVHGELGATGADRATPGAVQGVALADALSAGSYLTCAGQTGTFTCWGFNGNGELGVGDNATPKFLTKWGGATAPSLAAVVPGNEHSCALLATGGVQCSGWNNEGECGSGVFGGPNFNGYETWNAVTVTSAADAGGSLGNVAKLISGGTHTCALTKDARVFCWGMGIYGQVGNGGTSNVPAPAAVVGLP